MPAYKRTAADTVELPDLGLTVAPGDVVDLPDGMYEDYADAGFAPVDPTKKSTPDAVPAADAPQE